MAVFLAAAACNKPLSTAALFTQGGIRVRPPRGTHARGSRFRDRGRERVRHEKVNRHDLPRLHIYSRGIRRCLA